MEESSDARAPASWEVEAKDASSRESRGGRSVAGVVWTISLGLPKCSGGRGICEACVVETVHICSTNWSTVLDASGGGLNLNLVWPTANE